MVDEVNKENGKLWRCRGRMYKWRRKWETKKRMITEWWCIKNENNDGGEVKEGGVEVRR
jgi:hypothetical protein